MFIRGMLYHQSLVASVVKLLLAFIYLHAFCATNAQSWKNYPLNLENNPHLTFPDVEGAQNQYMGDSWFFTAQVTGETTGKRYQVVTIFNRNSITAVVLNFYQASIFDYETGSFNTFTEYDLPVVSLLNKKFYAGGGHLDVGFNSSVGDARWQTVRTAEGALSPFEYNLHCPGKDVVTGTSFGFTLDIDMNKKPVAFGASQLRGFFTFFLQKNTLTYWQPGPSIEGTLTLNGITERVFGNKGHLDRQIFPLYSGILTPTFRDHSHEWRQVNLDNGVDLSIWRQFARYDGNKVIEDSGVTVSYPPSQLDAEPPSPKYIPALPDDLQVEYYSYAKYPFGDYSPLVPGPSKNMYLPSKHVIRSQKLDMQLTGTYLTPRPAAKLPVEYFEGPMSFTGTFEGAQVTGVGILESTLGLYRDWELADVLLDSVSHLPINVFTDTAARDSIVDVARGLRSLVSPNPLADQRLQAQTFAKTKVIPALEEGLQSGEARAAMLEIANDFIASLLLLA